MTHDILARIRRAMHSLYDARPGTCCACRKPWPCLTRRKVDPKLDAAYRNYRAEESA